MSQMLALLIVMVILYLGDAVSVRTKAWIPSVFVCAVLFLFRLLDVFPEGYRQPGRYHTGGSGDADVSADHQHGDAAFGT
ncbi:Uncharacterised protein [Serratia fonticola]|uniref:Uncharacterized protein n=1 Tax=Serratia fonticola TaxID=47917 RepID=A0A4V6KM33_SERFO|nr:Uncharacterised protein [Serratia fonticola]